MHYSHVNHLSHQAEPLITHHLNNNHAAGLLIIFLIGFFIAIMAVVNIFYLLSIYKTLSYVPHDKRCMPNAFIWLSYIPLAGIVFYWLMQLIGIPASLSNALSNNVEAVREAKKLRLISIIKLLLVALILYCSFTHSFAILSFFAVITTLILWILYWVKIVDFRKEYFINTPNSYGSNTNTTHNANNTSTNSMNNTSDLNTPNMSQPTLLSTKITNETFANVTYHINGELVPSLIVDLNGSMGIYFENHILLWKSTSLNIQLKKLSGVLKRTFSGLPVFVTETRDPGQIAFSRNFPGHIFPIHMQPGQQLIVREHQFLAATNNINYNFEMVRGLLNKAFGGGSFIIDRFSCADHEGILWIHGYGNVFEKVLAPGEQIDLREGSWVYRDPSVNMETKAYRLTAGLLSSSDGFIINRFTGPGRLGIQTFSIM